MMHWIRSATERNMAAFSIVFLGSTFLAFLCTGLSIWWSQNAVGWTCRIREACTVFQRRGSEELELLSRSVPPFWAWKHLGTAESPSS